MTVYLGTHETSWLKRTDTPLFVSRRRLARLKGLYPSRGRWALDSGGFSELVLYDRYQTSPAQYAGEAQRYQAEIGQMDFAAIQDWMCEPMMIAKTGLSVREHQQRTIQSCLDLMDLAPDVPWCPIIQGYSVDDYLWCVEQYESNGISLRSFDRVGVGSVCKRQATREAIDIFATLRPLGLKLHGFGLKAGFLRPAQALGVESCDSLAWSKKARLQNIRLPDCSHTRCTSCLRYATLWHAEVVTLSRKPKQELLLF